MVFESAANSPSSKSTTKSGKCLNFSTSKTPGKKVGPRWVHLFVDGDGARVPPVALARRPRSWAWAGYCWHVTGGGGPAC
jgi:hypothetical protein